MFCGCGSGSALFAYVLQKRTLGFSPNSLLCFLCPCSVGRPDACSFSLGYFFLRTLDCLVSNCSWRNSQFIGIKFTLLPLPPSCHLHQRRFRRIYLSTNPSPHDPQNLLLAQTNRPMKTPGRIFFDNPFLPIRLNVAVYRHLMCTAC